MSDPWSSFCAALPPGHRAAPDDAAQRELASLLARARDAWPDLELDALALAEAVARAVAEDERPLDEAVASIRAGELALATACAQRQPRALAAFQREFGPAIERALAGGSHHTVTAEEIRQAVMVRLFVDEGRRKAKIGMYAGRGKLVNWVRIVVSRTRADLIRAAPGRERPIEDEDVDEEPLMQAVDSPEARHLEQQYRVEFREAFTDAMQALTPAQRNLLRQRIVFGLKIEEIAALFEIHPATVKRRLARARQALGEETQRILLQRLRLGGTELDSLLRVVQSRVDVSVRRILGSRSR